MGTNDENWVLEVCVTSMSLLLGISREGRWKDREDVPQSATTCQVLPGAGAGRIPRRMKKTADP